MTRQRRGTMQDAIETRLEQDFDENWYYAGTGLHPRPGDTVYLDYSA